MSNENPAFPIVSTMLVSDIQKEKATFTANISSVGYYSVSERGFQISTNACFSSITSLTQINTYTEGQYVLTASNLIPNTKYYVRAYAKNLFATNYGETLEFTTLPDLNTALIAKYLFYGNALDESGNNYNGTIYGATLTTDRFGKSNSAFLLNGTDNYISTNVTGASGITNAVSLCAWYKTSNKKSFQPIIVLRNGTYDVAGLYASTWGDGMPSFDYSYGVGYFRNVFANDKMYANDNWHFVVGTFDGKTSKIFVDGVLKQESNENILKSYTGSFLIGKDNGIFFEGKIDDIRIYSRALSESDVKELYLLDIGVSSSKNVVCNETQIECTQGIDGIWSVVGSNATLSNNSIYNPTVQNLQIGENIIQWNVFYKSFQVKINYQPPFAGNDTLVYSTEKPSAQSFITLKAQPLNAGTSGVWTSSYPNSVIENSTSNLTKVYNIPSGKHTFKWTVSDGTCSDFDEITIFKRTNINSDKSGNWNDELSWKPNTIPTRYDSVTIAGHNIYLTDFTANAYCLVVKNSGNLFVSGNLLEGILNLGDLWVFEDSKSTKGNSTVNVKKGGKVNVQQGIDKKLGKTSDNGKGTVKVKSGGKVNVQQGIDKLEGLAQLIVNGQIEIENNNPNLTAATLFIGNNGVVKVLASSVTKSLDKLLIKGGGSIVIEQDVEAIDPALSVWGDILIENTNATKAAIASTLTIKGGKVNVQQGIDKNNSTVKVKKGGKVNVQQGIDKLNVASSFTSPELIITDGNVVVGNISGTVSGTNTLECSHISVFQLSKKTDELPNLLIAASGKLQLIENSLVTSSALVEVGDSATVSITLNASIVTEADNSLTVFEIEDGGSVIIETSQPDLSGRAVVNTDFMQGNQLFSSPVAGLNSSHVSTGNLSLWSESQKDWQALSSQIDLLPLQAFKYTASAQNTQSFDGTINAGLLSVNLKNSNLENPNTSGWNLVGNPYTSALDWEMVTLENIENSVYRFNPITQNYMLYQQGGFNVNAGNQLISMSEGFFVKVKPTASEANFNLGNSQVHNLSSLLKLRKPETKNSTETLRLTLTNGSQSDQTLLALETGANLNFETSKDAFKLLAAVPQIYTQTTNGENLAINVLEVKPEEIVRVPLYVQCNQTGSYSISSDLNIAIDKLRVFLHHFASDTYINLSETTNYTFNVSETGTQKLFEIVFNFSTVGIDEVTEIENIRVFSNQNQLFVNSDQTTPFVLEIYNVLGSKMYQQTFSGKTNYQIETQFAEGIYLVKIVSAKQTFVKQVFLN